MDLEKTILAKIEEENIRMRPRWFFRAKDASGVFSALVFLLGSAALFGISTAVILHWASEISSVNFPYSLIVLSVTLATLAYLAFDHSFSFYKLPFSWGIMFLCAAVFFLGYAMFTNGLTERIEGELQQVPAYRSIAPKSFLEHEESERDHEHGLFGRKH